MKSIRSDDIPPAAVSASVSLDGVMVALRAGGGAHIRRVRPDIAITAVADGGQLDLPGTPLARSADS